MAKCASRERGWRVDAGRRAYANKSANRTPNRTPNGTPNGIRTRAATLKGWMTSKDEVTKDTGQKCIRHI